MCVSADKQPTRGKREKEMRKEVEMQERTEILEQVVDSLQSLSEDDLQFITRIM